MGDYPDQFEPGPQRRLPLGRIGIAVLIAIVSLVSYYAKRSYNPVTNKVQHIDISPKQEIALGLEAAPQMSAEYGGESPDPRGRAIVEHVGRKLISTDDLAHTPYPFTFHLLADPQTINAFALPGGQVFITEGLFQRLRTEGQLAGVLGHEVGHVVARHGAEQIAKTQLTQGLTGAAVLATYDPDRPSTRKTAAMAALVGQLVTLRYGRKDELEADRLGVRFGAAAGYDPQAMIKVMEILRDASQGSRQPEFFSTHPNPENRIGKIEQAIREQFPNGVPSGLTP